MQYTYLKKITHLRSVTCNKYNSTTDLFNFSLNTIFHSLVTFMKFFYQAVGNTFSDSNYARLTVFSATRHLQNVSQFYGVIE